MSKREPLARIGSEKPRKPGKKLDHLTRDVLAAEKAGMSYGQWKAKHPYTYTEEDDAKTPLVAGPDWVTKTCQHCGGRFQVPPGNTNKLYCSNACQIKHNADKKMAQYHANKTDTVKTCPVCGKSFVRTHANMRYCGKFCATEVERQRENERREKKRQEKKATATCLICGKDISDQRLGTKYCGKYCKAQAKHQTMNALREKRKQEETENV